MKTSTVGTILLLCISTADASTASFTCAVVDADTGTPIQGAICHAAFQNRSTKFFDSGITVQARGLTDINGFVKLSGKSDMGKVGWSGEADGYYSSIGEAPKFNNSSFLTLGQWTPLNQVVTAQLDRVISPIPLYVKRIEGEWYNQMKWKHTDPYNSPCTNTVIAAYDLFKGDWLPPYGNGEHEDIRFSALTKWLGVEKISRRHQGMRYRTDYCIEFPGDGNGTCEVIPRNRATLKLRVAPTSGYVGVVTRWEGWFGVDEPQKSNFDTSRCFAFRVRTRKDKESGKIIESYYGKIYGDWNFLAPSSHGGGIVYYLNTTHNDRNLEWDRQNNHCPNPGGISNPRP